MGSSSAPGASDDGRSGPFGTTISTETFGGRQLRAYQPRPQNVGELVAQARSWAERCFLVQDEQRLSFAEVEQRAWRGATKLHDLGLGKGDRVMLLAANSPEWVIAFLSSALAGCVTVLGNCWWSSDEVHDAIQLTQPAVVLTDDWTSPRCPASANEMVIESLAHGDRATPIALAVVVESDPALVVFTSGTTGSARGAVLSHRAVVAMQHTLLHQTGLLHQGVVRSRPADVTLQSAPLFHIGGVQALLRALLTGSTLVLPRGRFDAGQVLEIIEREGVQRWGGVPTMVLRVLDHPDLAKRDITSVRSVSLGGAPVPSSLVDRIRCAFPGSERAVGKIYGLTEAGGTLTSASGSDLLERPGTVGKPLPLVEVRISNPDTNGEGEIVARSATQMSGYLGGVEESIIDGDGWIHTGDLGLIADDGYVYVTGRSKDVIIRGGENIASSHVEERLTAHPDILECAVLGLPDANLGEEVAAAIVLRPGSTATARILSAYARERLASFEVPTRWWFREGALPCNDSGKIDKRALIATWPSGELSDPTYN
ncbi:MAG: class I adenylate-forming enzyme family protein [Acidimicrobiales bacterium]